MSRETDIDIIRRIEKKLEITLREMPPGELEKDPGQSKIGFTINQDGVVTGIRLDQIYLKPVLHEMSRFKGVETFIISYSQLSDEDTGFLRNLEGLRWLGLRGNHQVEDFSFLRDLKRLTSLDLSGNNLEDVSFLRKFKGLTSLSLSRNDLKDVSCLRDLKRLTSLDLSRNDLKDVSCLRDLKRLTSLDLSGSNLEDFSFLREFKGLTSLDLSYNRLKDVSFLRDLKRLTSLDLSWNDLNDVFCLRNLKGLTSLNLSWNDLKEVSFLRDLKGLISLSLSDGNLEEVSFLRDLKRLTSLNLSRNDLKDVSFLRDLKDLTSLDLSRNDLKDVSFLRDLKDLTSLSLSGANLEDASFLKALKSLTSLFLKHNSLKDVSFLEGLVHLTYVDLSDNPIETPPPEIVAKGLNAIRDYFRSLEESETKQLNEVKVLLVGDGAAGKTSLVKQLLGEPFEQNESKTHGINIRPMEIPVEFSKDSGLLTTTASTTIKAHLWDFGGQEIMHASHKFFLSKRSLYILVAGSREDQKADYWLKHIESFGGDSQVLVVINKIDENPAFEMDRYSLRGKYKNIRGFHRVSCKSGEGIPEFKQALQAAVPEVELLNTTIAASWLRVKERLETQTSHSNYLNHGQFQTICQEEKVTDDSSRTTLIEFLNELGIVLHFRQLELEDFHVLNPRWVTEAVYKIINSQYLANCKGILEKEKLGDLLNKETQETHDYEQSLPDIDYTPTEQNFILSLMEKFHLCYSLDETRVLVPDLLAHQAPPVNEKSDVQALRFMVKYHFLPRSVMPRLIIGLHRDIKDQMLWRTGIVLENAECKVTARVSTDDAENTLFIRIIGKRKREYLAIIRRRLAEIHDDFEKLPFEELVPLPIPPEIVEKYNGLDNVPEKYRRIVEYENLLGFEDSGRSEYFDGVTRISHPVGELLDNMVSLEERTRHQREDGHSRMGYCQWEKWELEKELGQSKQKVGRFKKHKELELKFKKEQTLKDRCETNATEKARRFTSVFVGVHVLVFIAWALLFFLYGSSIKGIVDPWVGLMAPLFQALLFFLTGKSFSPTDIHARRLKKETDKQYDEKRFDQSEYNQLKEELDELRRSLHYN